MTKLSKAQLIERLTALGVAHDPEQSNKVLQALLDEALEKQAATATETQPAHPEVPQEQTLTVDTVEGTPLPPVEEGNPERVADPVEEPDAQTLTQQDSDGQTETQPDAKPEDPEQEQDQDSTGQQGGDSPSDTPAASEGQGDSKTEDPAPLSEYVRVRLGADSPVGRLVIPGFSGFDRHTSAVISRSAFDDHKVEYHIEEVTD
ncbi:hypothetical protein [Deinococcus cellulosilyticus]|uniref:Uncharacterized protein n=1 Tax=Deinococcus cellulosilyticus (strain DSM 18568 / NBRC 106333 / KACC 11606 / 5516J-15) TaxID=1223518 RepID=A0A511N2Y4_DEIC1|nr:hypothetical protein [Deinococcus cellulosilyticus]GEM47209.1 hypothetical protein DC3_28440 [Deinococcus cellulosilyticus NBRC 106333 = KACC 11606]